MTDLRAVGVGLLCCMIGIIAGVASVVIGMHASIAALSGSVARLQVAGPYPVYFSDAEAQPAQLPKLSAHAPSSGDCLGFDADHSQWMWRSCDGNPAGTITGHAETPADAPDPALSLPDTPHGMTGGQ